MTAGNHKESSKKYVAPVLVAFAITAFVGIGMFALGMNAFFGKDVQAAQAAVVTQAELDAATSDELKALVLEYQDREAQYLAELTQAAGQLDQANTQVSNYQSLLAQLEQAGVIQIDRNGRVTVLANSSTSRSTGSHEEHEWDDD